MQTLARTISILQVWSTLPEPSSAQFITVYESETSYRLYIGTQKRAARLVKFAERRRIPLSKKVLFVRDTVTAVQIVINPGMLFVEVDELWSDLNGLRS